ncbi:MAG: hypothetical protein L6Q71_10425, partial [Planctomycetes bacterium]|nr:hypothetical protein [Planctomycetota bacterium]
GIENLSDKYSFNIVVYSTESNLIDPRTTGWVQATAPNKIKFVNLVKRLDMGTMTNIHGAMLDSFRLTAKNLIAGDPATDPEGFASGADTIFFLTDGWGSWSDDSKGKVADPRRSDKDPVIGDGQFILAADILRDFRRINKFRKVVVNSVGIGNHDKELMRGFANASGGTYVDLGD